MKKRPARLRKGTVGPWILFGKLHTKKAKCHICGRQLVGIQLVYSNRVETIVVGSECVKKFEQKYQNPKTYRVIDRFPSKSKPGTYYTVKMDEKGNLSCNCPIWIYKQWGRRDCPHVRIARSEYMNKNPVSLYESFHGTKPIRKRKVYFQEPKGELVKIGRLVRIEYEPEFPSELRGIRYYHTMGDTGTNILKSNAILATDLKGKNIYIIKDKKTKHPYFSRRGVIG